MNPKMVTQKNCAICGAASSHFKGNVPGYREGSSYEIFECPNCDASVAFGARADESLYQSIYRNASNLPGYARYWKYAVLVEKSKKPLEDLANSEESYWAVAQVVSRLSKTQGRPLRILEIGSGLGYLTSALRTAGHDACGIDTSKEAVEVASNRFGPNYRHLRAEQMADIDERYDLLVASQLIEHLENPVAFVRENRRLLNHKGSIFLSTPNKDSVARSCVWETELPPVHLWWFSERSMAGLARATGMGLTRVDLTEFYRKRPQWTFSRNSHCVPNRGSVLDANGNPLATNVPENRSALFSAVKTVLWSMPLSTRFRDLLYRRKNLVRVDAGMHRDICVLLSFESV